MLRSNVELSLCAVGVYDLTQCYDFVVEKHISWKNIAVFARLPQEHALIIIISLDSEHLEAGRIIDNQTRIHPFDCCLINRSTL